MAKKVEKEDVRFVDYSKNIEGAILQVKKDGVKLKHKIHNVALSIVTAWGKGQIKDQVPADYFNALMDAAGYHAKPLGRWIELKLKGKLAFSDVTDKWYVMADAKANADTFKACRDEPFWEVSPPPKFEPMDFQAMLYALLDKNAKASSPEAIEKRKAKGIEDKLIPLDQVRKMKELLAQG